MVGRDPKVVSVTMRRVRGKDTAPEQAFRRALWARGLRFRLHRDDLPGKPDIVFPKPGLAIFVDGDFWHGNQWKLRGLDCLEAQFEQCDNRVYWIRKIQRNVARDGDVTLQLEYLGWKVLRFWESTLRENLDSCVAEVVNALEQQR
jgi:DNA mismatch endonuclease (patch repair protein)